MKTKGLLLTLLLLLFQQISFGQSIHAGIVTANDIYVALDTNYKMQHVIENYHSDSKTIDLDQNEVAEIMFSVLGGNDDVYNNGFSTCEVLPMFNQLKFASRKDTSYDYNNLEFVMDVPIIFNEGDIINSDYDYTGGSSYLWSTAYGTMSMPEIADFSNLGKFYIGFSLEIGTTYYGWIAVEIEEIDTLRKIIIHDVAYNNLTTGISEISNEVNVFPNPFQTYIQIQVPGSNGYTEILITDILGKQYIKENMNKNKTLDLSYFPKGVYFIQLNRNQKRITKRIIKN